MAEEEPILTNPPTQEMARHVHDYDRFTTMFKWGALVAFLAAMLALYIIT